MRERDSEIKRVQVALGETLREFREDKDISQVNLGLDADYHWSHISEIERGRRQPGIGAVFILCKHLGISTSKVIEEVEKKLKGRERVKLKKNR